MDMKKNIYIYIIVILRIGSLCSKFMLMLALETGVMMCI